MKTLILLLLFFSSTVHALELTGEAYASSQELAQKQSLASLSESLRVEVKSTFESTSNSKGLLKASQVIKSQSNLPLLGVVTDCVRKKQGEFFCISEIKTNQSLALYQASLKQLSHDINQLWKQQTLQKNNAVLRYRTLNELLAKTVQFEKFATVARLLDGSRSYSAPVFSNQVQTELLSIETNIPTIDIATEVLTRDLPDKTYFVQPPLPFGSKHATQLSRILRDSVQSKIKATNNLPQANYFLKGNYQILNDSIIVTYHASNLKGDILASRIVKLPPAVYQNIRYQADNINFEQLLHEGYVVSNKFRAEINTNYGKEDLLFSAGQTIEIFAKLNQPGYFYIAAYNTAENLSYLLEFNDVEGDRAFIQYVDADNVNRWISLGEFEVSEPFGTENLQLIASNIDLIHHVPATVYNPATRLFHIDSSSTKTAVLKTRALKPKKKKSVRSAEATLTYTTNQ